MHTSLVIPRATLRRWMNTLTTGISPLGFCRLGVSVVDGRRSFYARDIHPIPALVDPVRFGTDHLLLTASEQEPPDWARQAWHPGLCCRLWLGRGRVAGMVKTPEGIAPLHSLSLPGSGMHRLFLTDDVARPSLPDLARHSRTVGALGGEDIWTRLAGLNVNVIGCGRTGSLVAGNLARLGTLRITLTDPDPLDEHSLGEMDLVTAELMGLPKSVAVARALIGITRRGAQTYALPVPVSNPAAIDACRTSDVLFCCVDNDAARLTAGILAALHHKVLLDIGTGIRFSEIRNRVMGADLRLILPGDGCLLCQGNLANYARAVEEMVNGRVPLTTSDAWRQERAGSLRSLNQVAAGLATRLFEDVVAGRIRTSLWARVECDDSGRFDISYPQLPGRQGCPLCARAGEGDAALRW